MRRKELMAPIRTRGAVRRPVRTRGPLRTHGAVRGRPAGGELDLGHLIGNLRQDVSNLPLTTVIYGWGTDASRRFLDDASRFRTADDVFWLVPSGPGAGPPPPPTSENVLLDLNEDMHSRTLRNLIADIVFVPGGDLAKEDLPARSYHHTRALLVAAPASDMDAVARSMSKPVPPVYRWAGSGAVEKYIGPRPD
jgi:hypothetical protein